MSQHGLEVLGSKLPILMDLGKQTAPFVDHFGLFSRCPSYTHRVVHDDEAEGKANGEGETGYSFCDEDTGAQCDHHGGMGGGHATCTEEQFRLESALKRPDKERLEELGYECSGERSYQWPVRKQYLHDDTVPHFEIVRQYGENGLHPMVEVGYNTNMDHSRESSVQSAIINSASFFAQFAISMVNLALVYHLRVKFSLSAQMVGLSAAIYTTTYFLCCLVLGRLASHLKPRHSVELSMLGMAGATAIVIATDRVSIAFMALVLYGVSMSFLWPQIEGWLARGKEGRSLNKATSSFNVAWSVGAALSPYLTGVLLERSTGAALFAGLLLFVAVFLLILLSTYLVPGIRAVVSERHNLDISSAVDASTPLRFLSWAGVLTVYASLAVTLTIFPMHAMDNLPFSESMVGFLLFVRGMSTVVMFLLMGKSSIWHFKRKLVLTTQMLVALVCVVGTRMTSLVSHVIFFFLFGVLFAMSYSYSIFHGASGSVNRSQRMLIHEVLLTIGTVLGSLVGGTVYQHFGFAEVLLACAVLVMVPVVYSMVRKVVG